MSEPQIVNTLRTKRDEIERLVASYEKQLDLARRDLTHVSATLAMFEASGDDRNVTMFFDTHRLMKRGEIVAIAKAALAADGPLNTRELSRRIATAKGLDASDAVLVQAIGIRAIRALTLQRRRGLLESRGKNKGALVWRLPG